MSRKRLPHRLGLPAVDLKSVGRAGEAERRVSDNAAAQCAVADVAPVESPWNADAPRCGVGAIARGGQIIAERANCEYASARADDVAAFFARACVEDFDVCSDRSIETVDRIAGARLGGITVRRDDDADRRTRIPERIRSTETSLDRGQRE